MKWCVLLIVFLLQHHLHDAKDLHVRKKRVVGGYISPDGLFPYAVSLRINKFGYYMHFCGGAIISERFFLSSAHCMLLQDGMEYNCFKGKHVEINKFGYYMHFCGGAIISERFFLSSAHCMLLQDGMEYNCFKGKHVESSNMKYSVIGVVGSNKLHSESSNSYDIESYMYHSEFSFKLGLNDISLLRTAKTIVFSKYVSAIVIHNKEIPVDSVVVVPGWGLTSFPGEPSDKLKYIDLRTISYDDCVKAWKKVFRSQICTYTTSGEGVCTSDSGGPLVYKGELVGLVSFGKPCAVGFPDVYTNVTHMYRWISYNMKCLSEPDLLDKLLI